MTLFSPDTKTKLKKCIINAFYSFGITLASCLASYNFDWIKSLPPAITAFIAAFFVAFSIVYRQDLVNINKKGKLSNSILLF